MATQVVKMNIVDLTGKSELERFQEVIEQYKMGYTTPVLALLNDQYVFCTHSETDGAGIAEVIQEVRENWEHVYEFAIDTHDILDFPIRWNQVNDYTILGEYKGIDLYISR